VRIVAGRWRGRTIEPPADPRVRPTADRVREAWMSIVMPELPGARVLDLFAGSGALGIEALSRGASEAVFVESDHRAADAIRANLRAVGDPDAIIWVGDALAYLRRAATDAPFDLVFADPPYSSATQVGDGLSQLLPPLLTQSSLTVTESDKRAPLPLTLPLADERVYGDTRIAIHRGA
jgi:16S rRNA (guanine966-N2)-methyltransferase